MDLKSLSKGMIVEDKFALISQNKKTASNGKPYLVLELSHKTGNIKAKVWQDNFNNVNLNVGKIHFIDALFDSFGGYTNLVVRKAYPVEEDDFDNFVKATPTLVFDIETAGIDFDDLDEWNQDYFLNTLEKYTLEKAKTKTEGKKEASQRTGLYPLYGQVVSIGMYNPENDKGMVLTQGLEEVKIKDDKFSCQVFENEKLLLENFWKLYIKYDRFVTFNGTGFDYPFLLFRSAINQVKVPTEIKYYGDEHIDLMKKFSSGHNNFKLEALCRAFGITNPKEKGVSGLHVSNLFREGKIQDIADYVSRDAYSTSELYKIWKTYMAGKIIV